MCEAKVYMMTDEAPTLLMEAVDAVEPEGDGLKLVNIFGDQKFVKATIHSLALVDHTIYLKPTE